MWIVWFSFDLLAMVCQHPVAPVRFVVDWRATVQQQQIVGRGALHLFVRLLGGCPRHRVHLES